MLIDNSNCNLNIHKLHVPKTILYAITPLHILFTGTFGLSDAVDPTTSQSCGTSLETPYACIIAYSWHISIEKYYKVHTSVYRKVLFLFVSSAKKQYYFSSSSSACSCPLLALASIGWMRSAEDRAQWRGLEKPMSSTTFN